MRVILELAEPILEKLEEMAASENRSRKNFMELILQVVTIPHKISLEPTREVYDAPKIENPTHDEPKQYNVPETSEIDEIPQWKKNLEEYRKSQKNK